MSDRLSAQGTRRFGLEAGMVEGEEAGKNQVKRDSIGQRTWGIAYPAKGIRFRRLGFRALARCSRYEYKKGKA